MIDWIIEEWGHRGLGVLIVGGQVMVADGLRGVTKDPDACLAARQCPRMLDWLEEKEKEGHKVQLRLGSSPIHPDWLARGWTSHVSIDDENVDFFGIPLRASNRIAERFWLDPKEVALASLLDLGPLKRTERPKDWDDIELIASQLRRRDDSDGMLFNLFGDSLVTEFERSRDLEAFRESIQRSQQAELRPILRMGLDAPIDELGEMARAEQRFWTTAGSLRSQEIVRTARGFWKKHLGNIRSAETFTASHQLLQVSARHDLPLDPVQDPAGLIEAARRESGTDRWPGLLPPAKELVMLYFPFYRVRSPPTLKPNPNEQPGVH